jgi:hypothetical protein
MVTNPKESNQLEDLGVDGWMILNRTLNKQGDRRYMRFIWVTTGISGVFL